MFTLKMWHSAIETDCTTTNYRSLSEAMENIAAHVECGGRFNRVQIWFMTDLEQILKVTLIMH